MTDPERTPASSLSIAAVEREIGLPKDTLRVWERRYGFPQPERDGAGDRLYPPEQVERLRLIRRLLDAGHRPGRVVPLAPQALQALATPEQTASSLEPTGELAHLLSLVRQRDAALLRQELGQAMLRLGLVQFITTVMAPLTTAIGDAWVHGQLQVFEEHLYTECITGVLRNAMASIPPPRGSATPRVLLTTLPQEPHALGLLMVETLLTMEGCSCLSLGPQTPVTDIVQAALAHDADVVALSFTALMGAKAVDAGLHELRRQLPPDIAIWAGGQCPPLYQRQRPGVQALRSLEQLREQVAHWRIQAIDKLSRH